MIRPEKVPAAIFTPGHCMICGGHEGEMIDTKVDFGQYRYYICMRMCVPLILEAAGQIATHIVAESCTATKKNGDPCTAYALPGRDVCVAHSKKPKVLQEV